MASHKFNDLTSKEVDNLLIEQIEKFDMKNPEGRSEFFRWLRSFRFNNYSLLNKLILSLQADAADQLPIFGTFKDWQKRGTTIKKGSEAHSIRVPQKYKVYFEKQENGQFKLLPRPTTKDELDNYENKIVSGEIKAADRISFKWMKAVFSLSQTNMPETERPAYIQRFNSENTSVENKKILDRLIKITKCFGIDYEEKDISNEALGWVQYNKGIVIKSDMPVDAKISVLSHEIGHKMLHHHNYTKELPKEDREVQAQLFSHMLLNSLGINSENDSSIKYIREYISKYDGKEDALGDVTKEVLLRHMQIVDPAVKLVKDTVELQPRMNLEDIDYITKFKPDIFYYDNAKEQASVISLNSDEGKEMLSNFAEKGMVL